MASKRLLKKRIKSIVYDVLDSCDFHIVNESSSADSADKLIDEAVDFHEIMIARLNAADSKKEFNDIAAEVSKVEVEFSDKLKGLE
jgi:hypothetical protein